jgi:hypothetical protein
MEKLTNLRRRTGIKLHPTQLSRMLQLARICVREEPTPAEKSRRLKPAARIALLWMCVTIIVRTGYSTKKTLFPAAGNRPS